MLVSRPEWFHSGFIFMENEELGRAVGDVSLEQRAIFIQS